MKKMLVLLLACAGLAGQPAQAAPQAEVDQVMSKPLADIPGKEGLMLVVKYPPGAADVIHRHNAHAFVYVIEGSIVMQVKGAEQVTLRAGQTFYEGPNDVHVVGRNASSTQPATFVVFMVKNEDVPFFVPAQ